MSRCTPICAWTAPGGSAPPLKRPAAAIASRLILANDQWPPVGYLLGVVEILPTAAEHTAVGHLGPDLLGPDWDPAEAERRLRADPAPAGRRGAARPAQPGRDGKHICYRNAVPPGEALAAGG